MQMSEAIQVLLARQFLCRFIASEDGSSEFLYAVLAAGLAMASVSSFEGVTQAAAAKYEWIWNAIGL